MKSLLLSFLMLLATAGFASEKEHKAMHVFTTSADLVCTAYAVGPHAVEVAEHCTADSQSFKLDGKGIRVKETISDHQDHDILILDGTDFQDFVVLNFKEAPVGGRVHAYINPVGWTLYDQYTEGFRSGSDKGKSGEDWMVFFFPVVGGASGSLIFNEDGSVAGVVSIGAGPYAWSSRLGFTASDLAKAAAK